MVGYGIMIACVIVLLLYAHVMVSTNKEYLTMSDCSYVLVQDGTQYTLYNTSKPMRNGSNPMIFTSMDEYKKYTDKQKSDDGIACPEVFVQSTFDTQGNKTYKVRSNPMSPQVVDFKPKITTETREIPTNTSIMYGSSNGPTISSPYTRNQYMDNIATSIVNALSTNQIQSVNKLELTRSILSQEPVKKCQPSPEDITPIVKGGLTADPMLPNWGGIEFSQQMVSDGYYVGNEVLTYRK